MLVLAPVDVAVAGGELSGPPAPPAGCTASSTAIDAPAPAAAPITRTDPCDAGADADTPPAPSAANVGDTLLAPPPAATDCITSGDVENTPAKKPAGVGGTTASAAARAYAASSGVCRGQKAVGHVAHTASATSLAATTARSGCAHSAQKCAGHTNVSVAAGSKPRHGAWYTRRHVFTSQMRTSPPSPQNAQSSADSSSAASSSVSDAAALEAAPGVTARERAGRDFATLGAVGAANFTRRDDIVGDGAGGNEVPRYVMTVCSTSRRRARSKFGEVAGPSPLLRLKRSRRRVDERGRALPPSE